MTGKGLSRKEQAEIGQAIDDSFAHRFDCLIYHTRQLALCSAACKRESTRHNETMRAFHASAVQHWGEAMVKESILIEADANSTLHNLPAEC